MTSHSDLYRTEGKGFYKVKKGATPICRQFTKTDLIWVSSSGEQIFAHVSVLAAQWGFPLTSVLDLDLLALLPRAFLWLWLRDLEQGEQLRDLDSLLNSWTRDENRIEKAGDIIQGHSCHSWDIIQGHSCHRSTCNWYQSSSYFVNKS